MRRVLHAVREFLPRSETFVYTVVTAHQRYEASVLCQSIAHADDFPFSRVHVHPEPSTKRDPAWWTAQAIERATGRSPWQRAVSGMLERIKPDVVHAHFGTTASALIPMTAAAGIPLVTSLYGVDAAVLPYLPAWRDAYARLFRDGDVFLAEGPEMRKKVIAAGAPGNRTVIQPISLDLRKYRRWAPDDSRTVLFVGRFVEKKGLLDAVAAFAMARRMVPDATMRIIGAGPDEASARAFVSRARLESVIQFAGMQPHEEVLRQLTRASVLIHPSVTAADGDSEGGAPTVLLEAQATGTPIVSTRHADIPHVAPVAPGVTLCDEHDVEALAAGLVAALRGREASSPAHVMMHHDIAKNIVQLETLYDARALASIA
jgi:colanic acid/amylovoran biosynthesis glycosyltransferase